MDLYCLWNTTKSKSLVVIFTTCPNLAIGYPLVLCPSIKNKQTQHCKVGSWFLLLLILRLRDLKEVASNGVTIYIHIYMTQNQFALPWLPPCQVPIRILAPLDLHPLSIPLPSGVISLQLYLPIISMWPNDPSPARPRSNFASSGKLALCQPLQLESASPTALYFSLLLQPWSLCISLLVFMS